MPTRFFLPSPRATNLLVALGFAALGFALYIRYLLVENSAVGLPCEAGATLPQCAVRQAAIFLFGYQVFGVLAILAAICQLLRPNPYTFGIALAAAAVGLVLYNNGLSALAVALLVISFARTASASTQPPATTAEPRTTGPASSKASR